MFQEIETTGNKVQRQLQVRADSGKKPLVVATLNDWQYLERSIHRMIAGWGRHFREWDDKTAVCRHIWEQSECVRKLRERLLEFPGTTLNLDLAVSDLLESHARWSYC